MNTVDKDSFEELNKIAIDANQSFDSLIKQLEDAEMVSTQLDKDFDRSIDKLGITDEKILQLGDDQKQVWLDATQGTHNATEAIKAYNDQLLINSLDYTVSFDPSTAFETMKSALDEQSSSGYLTDETLTRLKATYGDLSEVLTYTANGVQLNAEKMRELTELNAEAALVNAQLKEAYAVKEREKEVDVLNDLIYAQIKSNKTDEKGINIGYKLAKARNKGVDALKDEISATDSLTEDDAKKLNTSIDKIQALNDEINGYDALEQSIYATISALADYKAAKETANSSDDYNYVQSELKTNETAFNNGWTQTDEFREFMNYIGEFNEKITYSDEEIQKYMDRAKRYYTEDISGLFNFLDDASEKSDGLISKLADGSYDINVDDISALAEKMNMSISSVTDIMLAMKDADGFDIDFNNFSESFKTGLKNLGDKSEESRQKLEEYHEAIEKLKETGYDTTDLEQQYDAIFFEYNPTAKVALDISEYSEEALATKAKQIVDDVSNELKGYSADIELNIDSDNIEDINKQLDELSKYRDGLDLTIDVDEDGIADNMQYYENASTTMLALVKHKQELEKPAIMDVDVSELESNVQNAMSILQDYVNTKNLIEQQVSVGIDTSEAESHLANIKTQLNELPSGTLTTLGITAELDTVDFQKQIADINPDKYKSSTDITVSADVSQAKDEVQKAISDIQKETVKLKVKANTTDLGTSITNYLSEKTFSVKVKANVPVTGNGAYLMGSANSEGSAYANGNWTVGKKAGNDTLVGELGTEILVRNGKWQTIGDNGAEFIKTLPDDIIFNHKQAVEILKNGHINSRGKAIGSSSFADGSAFYTAPRTSVTGAAPSRINRYRSTASSNRRTNNSSSTSTDSANEFLEVMDWIEVKIQRCEELIERLDKVATNTFTDWTNRTSKLNKEISATADEIKWATAGYQEYLAKAESINLSEEYKQMVRDGKIKIDDITDENLKQAIEDYQNWYEKAVQLNDSIEDLNQQLSELQKMKFDNIIQQFEDRQSIPNNIIGQIDSAIDLAEARGRIISKKYYQAQIQQEIKNNALLVQERTELMASLNEAVKTGRIKQGSEAWYEMYNAIQEVNQAIIESNTSLVEYENSMRQVDWDLFDLAREKVDNLSSEIEFMTSLLDEETLTDGTLDRGLTNYGIAQIGQYATMYNIAMAQAQEYADEIIKIDKEIKKDPANQDLINRKQELVEAQRQAIQSANDEKQAMIDLARDGYDAVLDSLQELINKRNEALDAEKSLYDYQQSIAQKTTNIAQLQKQMAVYSNDNSEEAKKRIQQIQVELENSKEDLRQTEYDRYISDQKNLLDDLYNDYSDKIDEKFEITDNIIEEYIGITNANTSRINQTLKDTASDVGYKMSTELKNIWSSSTNTVTTFNNDFKTHSTSVLKSLSKINATINAIYRTANSESTTQINGATNNRTNGVTLTLVPVNNSSSKSFTQLLPIDDTSVLMPKITDNLLQNDISKYLTPVNLGNSDLSVNIQNINLDNVTDPKEFSSNLVAAIQSDKKVIGSLQAQLINPLVGKSTKKVNKY